MITEAVCARCGRLHPAEAPCPPQTSLLAPAVGDALVPGTVVGGRFRIECVAHRSSMSTVYRAVDTKHNEMPVALKELSAGSLSETERAEGRAWLAREAGLISSLHDARLPELIAGFSERDRHYVAMRFVAGETLEEQILRHGRQHEARVLRWAAELAELLAFLHSQQPPVVYRDLKPANVIWNEGPDPTDLCPGQLTLLDFGVARYLNRGVAGTAIGTPGYAAPEQYQGFADERSDLYGLGATMYCALTGQDLERVPPPHDPGAQLPAYGVTPATARLVGILMELDPRKRVHSASHVANLLAYWSKGRRAMPLFWMYLQLMVAVVVCYRLSVAIGGGVFGAPRSAPYPGDFKPWEPVADSFRALAVFLPGLLALLPLARPALRPWVARYTFARRHRDWAVGLVLATWLVPLAYWLACVWLHRWDTFDVVPGRDAAASWLPGLVVLAGIGGLAWGLRRLVTLRNPLGTCKRWRGAALVMVCVVALAAHLTAVAPATPPVQSAADVAFTGNLWGMVADSHGDLYVLDDFGLRERTPDGRFHLLVNLREPCSPYFVDKGYSQFGGLGLTQDETPILLQFSPGMAYAVRKPGVLEPLQQVEDVSQARYVWGGHGNALWVENPFNAELAVFDDTSRWLGPIQPVQQAGNVWDPVGLTGDRQGDIYVVNTAPGIHALQKVVPWSNGGVAPAAGSSVMLSSGGPLGTEVYAAYTVAVLPHSFTGNGNVYLTRNADGSFYVSDGRTLFLVRADGKVTTVAHGATFGPAVRAGHQVFFASGGVAAGTALSVTRNDFLTSQKIGKPFVNRCPSAP